MCLESEVWKQYWTTLDHRAEDHCTACCRKCFCHSDRSVFVRVCDIWMTHIIMVFSIPSNENTGCAVLCELVAWISPPHLTPEINLRTSCFVCVSVYEWYCCLSTELLNRGVWFHSVFLVLFLQCYCAGILLFVFSWTLFNCLYIKTRKIPCFIFF